jgi:hypothetical protein
MLTLPSGIRARSSSASSARRVSLRVGDSQGYGSTTSNLIFLNRSHPFVSFRRFSSLRKRDGIFLPSLPSLLLRRRADGSPLSACPRRASAGYGSAWVARWGSAQAPSSSSPPSRADGNHCYQRRLPLARRRAPARRRRAGSNSGASIYRWCCKAGRRKLLAVGVVAPNGGRRCDHRGAPELPMKGGNATIEGWRCYFRWPAMFIRGGGAPRPESTCCRRCFHRWRRCYNERTAVLLSWGGDATSGGRRCYFRWAAVLLLVGGGAASGSLGCCKVFRSSSPATVRWCCHRGGDCFHRGRGLLPPPESSAARGHGGWPRRSWTPNSPELDARSGGNLTAPWQWSPALPVRVQDARGVITLLFLFGSVGESSMCIGGPETRVDRGRRRIGASDPPGDAQHAPYKFQQRSYRP